MASSGTPWGKGSTGRVTLTSCGTRVPLRGTSDLKTVEGTNEAELLNMLHLVCCCCFSSEGSSNERQSLLLSRPCRLNETQSARLTRPARLTSSQKIKSGTNSRLEMRRVCVPELDQKFSDLAETFNMQQEHYELFAHHISNLEQSCGCHHHNQLIISECLLKIREECQDKYKISLKMKGYDFSVSILPVVSDSKNEGPLSPSLRLAQDELRCIFESSKVIISKGTVLRELINWLLRSKDKMAEQVKAAAATYQEQGRLNENLEENMRNVRKAKELSLGYRQSAELVLTEAAGMAGVRL